MPTYFTCSYFNTCAFRQEGSYQIGLVSRSVCQCFSNHFFSKTVCSIFLKFFIQLVACKGKKLTELSVSKKSHFGEKAPKYLQGWGFLAFAKTLIH